MLGEQNLPDLTPIRMEDFERNDSDLQAAKTNRSLIEYYFTCTPSLPLYVLRSNPEVDRITYIDADLYFFSSVTPVFDEIGKRSIAITPHRFAPEHRWMEKNGVFNVGWLTFRRDDTALACLNWWRERCLEWCHDYVDGDRFADQKYLDRFPSLFGASLCVIEHKGVNLAAWNLKNCRLDERNGALLVDGQPVVFFHFHGVKRIAPGVIDPSLAYYDLRLSGLLASRLFRPYVTELREIRGHVHLEADDALQRKKSAKDPSRSGENPAQRAAQIALAYAGIFTRRFLFSPGSALG